MVGNFGMHRRIYFLTYYFTVVVAWFISYAEFSFENRLYSIGHPVWTRGRVVGREGSREVVRAGLDWAGLGWTGLGWATRSAVAHCLSR